MCIRDSPLAVERRNRYLVSLTDAQVLELRVLLPLHRIAEPRLRLCLRLTPLASLPLHRREMQYMVLLLHLALEHYGINGSLPPFLLDEFEHAVGRRLDLHTVSDRDRASVV